MAAEGSWGASAACHAYPRELLVWSGSEGTVAPVRGGVKEARGGAWQDAGVDIPEDLINLKRQFYAREAELAEVTARMPPSMAIAGGEAEVSAADQDAWDALWRAQGETVRAIHCHPAFAGLSLPERFKLDEDASKAARASS